MEANGCEQPELPWNSNGKIPKGKLELSYHRYNKRNRHVAHVLWERIDLSIKQFIRQASIQQFIEEIRWDKRVLTKKMTDGFKISNNHNAFYARRFNLVIARKYKIKMFFVLHKQRVQCSFGPLNQDLPDGGDNSGDGD